jgi:hypothetical protein
VSKSPFVTFLMYIVFLNIFYLSVRFSDFKINMLIVEKQIAKIKMHLFMQVRGVGLEASLQCTWKSLTPSRNLTL